MQGSESQDKGKIMPTARIYQRPKNAMQSGRYRTDRWILEFEPAEQKVEHA